MTAAYARVVVDVGAGDGRASLRLARHRPDTLAIALDPAIDRLRDGARTALRGNMPNVLFVVAAAQTLPRELDARADEVTINFPWGSLLSGLVRGSPDVLEPLARIAKRAARVRILLSVEPRDVHAAGLRPLDPAALAPTAAYVSSGFAIERCDPASREEIAASGSSWAKRLGAERRVIRLEMRRL